MLASLTGCKNRLLYTDNFELWGEPICLNKEVIELLEMNLIDLPIDYFLLHNEKLGQTSCKTSLLDKKNN